MSDTTQIQLFSVDNESSEPLYLQIEQVIRDWIDQADIGDRLPPELDIAKIAKVSRKTVRKAIEGFIKDGTFSRRARIGTVLEKKPVLQMETLHPLEDGFAIQTTKTLKMVLFSSSRYRRDFWQELVTGYNRRNRNIEIQIEWTPETVASAESYLEFVREVGADLVFLSDYLFNHFQKNNSLLDISSQIVDKLSADDYYLNTFFADSSEPPQRFIAPLYFSLIGGIWNSQITGDISSLIQPKMSLDQTLDFVFRLKDRVSQDKLLMVNSVYFLGAFGYPRQNDTEDEKIEWLCKGYQAIAALSGIKDRIQLKDTFKYEFVSSVLERKTAFCLLNMYSINHYLDNLSFSWGACPMQVLPGCQFGGGYNGVSIFGETENREEAERFIDYLISENTQTYLCRNFHFGVFHRRAAMELCNSVFHTTDTEQLDRIIETYRLHGPWSEKWIQTFNYDLPDQINQVIDGRLKADEAAKTALEYFNRLTDDYEFGGSRI